MVNGFYWLGGFAVDFGAILCKIFIYIFVVWFVVLV